MKKIISILLAAVMCTALAACSEETGESPETARDSVVIAIGSEPETLDPTQGWGHGNSPIVQSTLVKYTADLTFENDLATDYSLSDDGLVWTFKIRDDVTFTDGEKLTAADVAFTLNTAKVAQGSVDLTYMESAAALDG
ncbi:MAG: ABC transporter substrate-binding protein, partial [Muribaculaceae bacterium]|nr:ABC transporter substrate-binding protein [Muribaculaceae bacterium]